MIHKSNNIQQQLLRIYQQFKFSMERVQSYTM